jgi:hypothetical membrane protein
MNKPLLVRLGAAAGVLAPVLFVIGFTVAGLLKPDQSPMHDVISDLGAGPFAWVQNANFAVMGVLLIAFAFAFYAGMQQVLTPTRLKVIAVLLGVSGLGFLIAAYFHVPSPGDPPAVRMRQGLQTFAWHAVIGWRLLKTQPQTT